MQNIDTTPQISRFLEDIGAISLLEAFDSLPDVLFWVKQLDGQILHCNKALLDHLGRASLQEVRGRTDYDFAPRYLAKQYVQDDLSVLRGHNVTERLELIHSAVEGLCWFSTTKRCLKDSTGKFVGTYGISRHLEKTSVRLTAMQALKMPVDFIRTHYMEDIQVADLAGLAHLSVSALERRFKKHLNMTPKQYIHEVRLDKAQKLLAETSMPIALVANATGFTDHSYFTRLFKRRFGELPSEFRDNYKEYPTV